MTPSPTAAWNWHDTSITELINLGAKIESRDREGWTALHHASWNGQLDVVQNLLKLGANVDSIDQESCTALLRASWKGHVDIARTLIEHRPHVNRVCTDRETPLQQAAWAGHIDVVELLIKSGASVNQINDEGLTALHQASVNGQEDVVELLLEAGADPRLQNSDGQTAYDQAEENSYATTALVLLSKGGPHPSLSSTSQSEEEIFELDPALAEILSVPAESCIVQRHGHACSSQSWKVTTGNDTQRKAYFLKTGTNIEMFEGERASLEASNAAVPHICPTVLACGQLAKSDDTFLLIDFIRVGRMRNQTKSQIPLARKLADLHLTSVSPTEGQSIPKFGFPKDTFAGPVFQANDWTESWAEFYSNNRLRCVCKTIAGKYNDEIKLFDKVDRIIDEVVPQLLAPGHLGGKNGITPRLVHGDLWSVNKTCGIINDTDGMHHYLFDASSCYAHSEYELGLMRMFGGFSAGFFSEYHRLVPKTEPKEEYKDRMLLYQLYHWLVNYAITGGGFKDEAMTCMDSLLTEYGDATSAADG